MITGAQAQEYYGMDNNYENHYGKDNYKSKDSSSAIVKKINCNNINVNVNGLEFNGLPPSLGSLLLEEKQQMKVNMAPVLMEVMKEIMVMDNWVMITTASSLFV